MQKNYIAHIRKMRGWSQEQLADKLDTNHQQISFLENGKRKLTWIWIQRLSNALECHPMDITEGPAKPEQSSIEQEILRKLRGMSETDQEKYLHMADIFLKTTVRE